MTTGSPLGLPLAQALGQSEPLTGLLQRVRASKARYEAIVSLLPAGMAAEVRPGPLDDSEWVLLVGNAAAAAKLRQLMPAIDETLRSRGWFGPAIKIKVLPRA